MQATSKDTSLLPDTWTLSVSPDCGLTYYRSVTLAYKPMVNLSLVFSRVMPTWLCTASQEKMPFFPRLLLRFRDYSTLGRISKLFAITGSLHYMPLLSSRLSFLRFKANYYMQHCTLAWRLTSGTIKLVAWIKPWRSWPLCSVWCTLPPIDYSSRKSTRSQLPFDSSIGLLALKILGLLLIYGRAVY